MNPKKADKWIDKLGTDVVDGMCKMYDEMLGSSDVKMIGRKSSWFAWDEVNDGLVGDNGGDEEMASSLDDPGATVGAWLPAAQQDATPVDGDEVCTQCARCNAATQSMHLIPHIIHEKVFVQEQIKKNKDLMIASLVQATQRVEMIREAS